MTKVWNSDKSLYARIGQNRRGEFSATIYMPAVRTEGIEWPAIGIDKYEGLPTKEAAIEAAKEGMPASYWGDDE